MKKLSIFGLAMALALVVSPVLASQFQLDFHGGDTSYPAGNTYESSITLNQGEKVLVDVWVTGLQVTPEIGSIDMEFQWDTGCLKVNSVDSSFLIKTIGLWDAAAGVAIPALCTPPNCQYKLSVQLFTGGNPGPVIQMQTLELEAIAACPSASVTATMGSNAIIDKNGDPVTNPSDAIVPVEVLPPPPCSCDLKPDDPATIVGSGSQLFTLDENTQCVNTPSVLWTDTCAEGNVDQTGLFTASAITAEDTCEVCATDTANTTDQQPNGVECCEDITLLPASGCATKIYKGGVCDESVPVDTIFNRPGRRGLSITCCEYEEFCVCSSCEDATFTWNVTILSGDLLESDLVWGDGSQGGTFMIKVKDPCTTYCPVETSVVQVCVSDGKGTGNDDCVEVTIGRVALGIGDTNAHPDTQTTDVDLLLWNTENAVKAIQTEVCSTDEAVCKNYTTQATCTDDVSPSYCGVKIFEPVCNADGNCTWKTKGGVLQCLNKYNCSWVGGKCIADDNMKCTACIVDEDRTAEFICSANEQADGCCMITLFSTEPDDLIQEGTGAVARIKYDVSDRLTSKDCVTLGPININIADRFNEPVCACPKTGDICFRICGDVYPQDCYECESCGDGIVDLFDILEEIDIILGLQNASLCQKMCGHGNVPLGMPPYCGNPAGVNPPNCECNQKIDIFDALVIIDKALSKMNCCDYCMFGRIY